ncbi:MAG: sulfite exporter TauE/SafE family protein [Myxococcota bacterium]
MSAFLAGLAMGVVFSLLGAGGGIIAVPVLMVLFRAPVTEATAGALAVVWAAAASGMVGHARGARVTWRAVWLVGLPSMAGAVLGAELHRLVPDRVTMALFAAVLLVATVLMFRAKQDAKGEPRLSPKFLVPVGLGLGVMTGFLGVGGGFLIVPALVTLARLPLKAAIGTSMAIITAASFTGALAYVVEGAAPMALVLPMGAGAMVGALVGAPLAGKLPERPLKVGFAVLAVTVSVGMGLKALGT